MRNLKQIMLFVMLGILLTFTSCSSDEDGGNPGEASSGVITAKVDGLVVTSMDIASKATYTAGGGGVLILQGTDSNGKGFVMTINGYDGIGVYKLTDDNIKGTFSFKAKNVNGTEKTISEGSFNLSKQNL